MDNSTHDMSEKLVQYLDGEMTVAEKESLEQLLTADKSLQIELENLKTAREAVMQFGLQQKVAGIHQQMMEEIKEPVRKINPLAIGSSRRIFRYSMAIAASLILIIGGIMAWNFYSLSPDKVYSANYHSYELNTMRDGDSMQVSPIEKTYRDKNYKEVTALGQQAGTSSAKETFLVAMSYEEIADNAKAIEWYKKVIVMNETSGTTIMKDEAEYYLALAYVRNKDFDFALELLRKIKDDTGHIYYKLVTTKLIRQVKMLKWR